jgi:hypothetical protein
VAVSLNIEVVGLKDALAELNTIDKKLRRQVTKDFKQIMEPVLQESYSRMPIEPPLRGMKYSWKGQSGKEIMHWQSMMVRKNLKAFTSGKKIRDTGLGFKQNVGVFGIRWGGTQGTIFDMARNGELGRQLTRKYGEPSRIVYRVYEMKRYEVEDQVKELVANVMRQVGRGGKI